MTSKKRRRKSRSSGGKAAAARGDGRGGARPAEGKEPAARDASARSAGRAADAGAEKAAPAEGDAPPRRPGLFGSRLREASPFPSFRDSAVAGARAVLASPWVLVAAFVSVLLLWLAFVSMDVTDPLTPKGIVNLMSLPPVYLLFTDGFVAFSPVFGSPAYGLLAAVVLGALRVVVFGAFVAVLALRLGWTEERPLRVWARAVPHLLLISLLFFGVAAAVPYLLVGFLGPGIGPLAGLIGPVLGLHFLVFAPISAVLDRAGYRDAVRRSARAARFPGGSHLASTFGYFAVAMTFVAVVPQPLVPPLTPTMLTWALVLLATFAHLAALGMFVFRWLVVREQVPAGAVRASR